MLRRLLETFENFERWLDDEDEVVEAPVLVPVPVVPGPPVPPGSAAAESSESE